MKHLPQAERLLSGTLSALLSAVATTMTVSNPPSSSRLPTFIELDPDSSDDRETVRAISVSGNIVTIERGVYDGGVGKQHLSNAPYKEKITQKHWDGVVDAVESGYLSEDASLTFTRNSTSQFRINSVDQTSFYSAGRVVRLNGSVIVTVVSSAFSGGNTVVTVNETTVPATITSVELAIGPTGALDNPNSYALKTDVQKDTHKYAADGGATDDYAITLSPVPTAYTTGMLIIFKANTANTGAATLNVNSLGAKTIKKKSSSGLADLATNDIQAGDIVTVVYDGTYMQIVSSIPAAAGGTSFWSDVPGTPTRVSDTQFTITDAANANKYDLLFKKGTILKWDESGTFQTAMVISSSYASDVVTINIVGDSLTAGFASMKYAIPKAMKETFIIPGYLSAATDIAKTWFAPYDIYVLSADLRVKTAGTGTGNNTIDINDDGSTKFTTKPSTTTGTSDLDNVADNPSTAVAAESAITIDVDAVTATTPAIEAYIDLWYYPVDWRYRS